MTAPKAPQWPLAPVLRLAALAMLFSVGALMTVGLLSIVMWGCAAVLVVLAAVKLGKNWRRAK
jgi:hypothetical protein